MTIVFSEKLNSEHIFPDGEIQHLVEGVRTQLDSLLTIATESSTGEPAIKFHTEAITREADKGIGESGCSFSRNLI